MPTTYWKLAKHQVYASEMMDSNPQLGIFYEAGCGKTMCVLDYLYRQFKTKQITNALVICPASIVSSWKTSIEKMAKFKGYTGYGISMMLKLVDVRSFQRTYERKPTQVRHRDGTVETKSVLKIRSEINHEWGAIIVDESQGLGAHDSVQTKICLQLAELTPRRFIMSGTPVSGGGGKEDFKKLYGQLKFLNPDLWPNWKAFCEELVTGYDYFGKPNRYKVEQCRELMRNFGIVARLNDCYDMPSSLDAMVPVELNTRREYEDVRKGDTEKFGIELKTGGAAYLKLLELCSGFILDDNKNVTEYPTQKLDAVKQIIRGTEDKVVIFCNFRNSIDRVAKVCEAHGKTVIYDGRSKGDTWRDFQYGDARYLVAQYQSGGVGIDLFSSHTMIFYEPTTSSLLMEQAKARIMRKGQEQKCIYHWIYADNSIEKRVAETVKSGVEVTREMLEEWAKLKKLD